MTYQELAELVSFPLQNSQETFPVFRVARLPTNHPPSSRYLVSGPLLSASIRRLLRHRSQKEPLHYLSKGERCVNNLRPGKVQNHKINSILTHAVMGIQDRSKQDETCRNLAKNAGIFNNKINVQYGA